MTVAGRCQAGVLLAAALIAANSAVFLFGRTFMPLAPSVSTLPGAPYGYRGPVPDAATQIDPAAALNQGFANDAYTAGELARGSLPFWNPRQGFGSPYLASGHTAVLYPMTAAVLFLPREQYEFAYLLNWYLAALFTYAYLRLIEVEPAGALLGGVAVIASGFFQYYVGFREASATAAWFPALLYCVERVLRDPAWRARHIALALAIYCTITAGQPESTGLALAAATLYGLASIAVRPRRAATLWGFVPGVIGAALISAPFWLTFSDYAFRGETGHDPGSMAAQSVLGWRTFASYLLPQLYGRPQTLPPWMVPAGWSWDLSPGWIPAAVGLGAVFGIAHAARTRSRPLLLVLGIAVIVAGRIWGVAPFTAIGTLPLFDRMVFPRYAAFVLAFAAAILAGAGWSAALSGRTTAWSRAAVAWIALVALAYLAAAIWREPVFRALQVRAFSVLAWLWIVLIPAGLFWLRRRGASGAATAAAVAAAMLLQLVAYQPGYPPETYAVLTVTCMGAWLLTVALFGVAPRTPRALVATAAIVCALPAIVLAASDRRGLARRYDATTAPPYVEALRALQADTGGRAYAIDGTPQPNFGSATDVTELNVCDPIQPRAAAQFMKRYLDPGAEPLWFSGSAGPRISGRAIDEFRARRRFFNLAAIRYLVTRATPIHPAAEDAGLRLVRADAGTGVQIWEDDQAFPRAFLACPAVEAASVEDALARLPALRDPRREIVVEAGTPNPCAGAAAPSGRLASFVARGNDVRIRYHADTPGVLVVADAYEPGWQATVDGFAATVLRVDALYRGVAVGAGDHAIDMQYRPPRWSASLALGGAGIAVLAVATIAAPRPRREERL